MLSQQLLEEIEAGQGEILTRAARRMPRTRQERPVSPSCLFRWLTTGVIGPNGQRVKLEGARLGGRWVTTAGAIRRFIAAQTPSLDTKGTETPRTAATQQRASERAAQLLKKLGI
jgi:hypothetical protein